MSTAIPVVNPAGEGELLSFGGGLVTFKVTSQQSGGAFVLFEHVASRGKTTPLHLHPDHDETAYVLEGELLMHIDGAEHTAGPGSVVSVPRGTPHAFLVVSETARSIWVITPGGAMEDFMRLAGDPAASPTAPPPDLDIERIKQAGERTGAMKALGPPPFTTAARAS